MTYLISVFSVYTKIETLSWHVEPIEFDCTIQPKNPSARVIATAKNPARNFPSLPLNAAVMLLCFIDSSIFCLLLSYSRSIAQTYEQIHIISACRQHRVLWHTPTPPLGVLHCMGRSDGKRNRQDITGHILMAHQWQVRLMCTIRSGSGL